MVDIPVDLLIPLFRGLILEEEEEWFEDTSGRRFFRPRIHVTLSLVCRHWRNTIASSSSLSTALIFDYARNETELRGDIERSLDRIGGAPASVHLYNIHNKWKCTGMNGGLAKHDRKHCPSSHSSIAFLLERLSRIHRIHLHFVRMGGNNSPVLPFTITRISHALRYVKYFSIDLPDGQRGGNYTLMKQLKQLPHLSHLRVYGITTCQIQFDAEHPNLLRLRSAYIGDPQRFNRRTADNLFNLLSHAQNLEEMKLDTEYWGNMWWRKGFIMPQLRVLEVKDAFSLVPLLLFRNIVQAPAIQELRYARCDDAYLFLLDKIAKQNPTASIIKLDQ